MLDAAWQPGAPTALIGEAIPGAWGLLTTSAWFVAATLAAFVGLYLVRRAARRWAQRDDRAASFTMQDLRDMRARGEITEQEFAAMRATLVGQLDASRPKAAPHPRSGGGNRAEHPEDDRAKPDGPPSPP
jgi:uncharacterized membrane protein